MGTIEGRGSVVSGRKVRQAPGPWRADLQRHDLSPPGARSSRTGLR